MLGSCWALKSIGLKNMQDFSSKSSTSKVKLDVPLVADGRLKNILEFVNQSMGH